MLWVSRCYPPVSVSLACVAVLGYVGQRMIIRFDALLPDFNSPSSNHVSLCKRLSFTLSRRCVQYLDDAFSVIKIVTCPSWVGEPCFWPFNARLFALQDQPHRDTYCWRPYVLFGPQTHASIFRCMWSCIWGTLLPSLLLQPSFFCSPTGQKCYVDMNRSCSEDTPRGESLEVGLENLNLPKFWTHEIWSPGISEFGSFMGMLNKEHIKRRGRCVLLYLYL